MGREARAKDIQFRRLAGASPEVARRIHEEFKANDDLRTTCTSCGLTRRGSWDHVTAPCPGCEVSNDT